MLGLDLYGTAFYLVSTFLFLFAAFQTLARNRSVVDVNRVIELFAVFFAIAVVSHDVSNRPFDMEGDTAVYINFFNDLNSGLENPFQTFEPGFIGIVRVFGYLSLDYQSFFYFITFMFLWSYYFLIKAIFGVQSRWSLIVFAAVLFYPFFFSLTANVIRQGFAMCFINLSLYCATRGYWKRGVIHTIIATLFHKSSIIYFPVILFRRLVLKVGVSGLMVLWLGFSLASYLKLFVLLVSVLFDLSFSYGLAVNYNDVGDIDYITGFRWDFWAFSSVAVILLVVLKLLGGELNKRETYIFYVCALLSCLHIAMFDVAYNDRFGVYSWIYYPLELAYVIRAVSNNFAKGQQRFYAEEKSITIKQGDKL
ncbi:EpsG family protein [Pseudomonas sp. 13B_3.2_Bac1]|uniref:EpsG family protein n=1 Tax=Pseudomonas sp. 13B_3.2_Bac1 TaxID=2971623 RepID=UPI0021C6DE09|nr:EpsG family protein [Pseudomonas sp. 13B_3.2_Bac1]MCU1772398.1 EpsG family protein [Pseudomonas sp. 13B_3.2_Bac1]